ncbi:MAG: C40 family peptidase [Clostridia bacterium]|nr:C40 family peptidase [Clostridia bacterium]
MKVFFNTAICPLYREADPNTEHVDEAFYGQWAEVLEEQGDYCRVRTEYGYEGYALRANLFFGDYAPTHVVTSGFGDLLPEPKNGLLALYCVPRGSKIRIVEGGTERYGQVETVKGETCYIHRRNIMPLEEKDRRRSEAEFRQSVLDTAKLYLGSGYRWGGKTVGGIDCSGLAFMSYYMNGVVLHRDAHFEKSPVLKATTLEEAKMGDLLFFPGHVAIYIGDGLYIHSTTALGGVGYNSFDENSPIFNKGLKEGLTQVATIF